MRRTSFAVAMSLLAACGRKSEPELKPIQPVPSASTFRFGDAAVIEKGRLVHEKKGCTGCHSIDGSRKVAPSDMGVFTRTREGRTRFASGETIGALVGPGREYPHIADYVVDKIADSSRRVIIGELPTMPSFGGQLHPDEFEAVVVYLASLDGVMTLQ